MTSKEWKTYKLSDFMEFNPRETLAKGTIAKKIAMENLQPFCRDVCQYEFAPYNGGVKLKNGDTIMARITPCLENGKTSKVNILEDNEIAFGSTEYIVFRKRDNISDENFIYYLVTSPKIREIAIKSMVGSSGRQRVQADVLADLELELPPLETQEKIARILSSLDDKIELNNKINQNLEQQAQAIFKSWFVDFEPFGGNMPENWERSNLLEIANYLNGLAMQKYRPKENELYIPVLKIKELRQGFCDNTSDICTENINDAYIVNNGDIIFSWSGSLLVDIWCGGKCGLNQHLFKVTSEKYDKWFYYFWTKHHLSKFVVLASDMATTMGHIKREELQKSEVIIPNKEDYQKINNIIDPILNLIINNKIQNKQLTQLRDTLLPKLMSGEINVDDVEV